MAMKKEIIEQFKQNRRIVRFSEKDKEWLSINAYFDSAEKIDSLFSIYLNEDETEFCVEASLSKDIGKTRYIIRFKLFKTISLDAVNVKELLSQAFDWADNQKFNEATWQKIVIDYGVM